MAKISRPIVYVALLGVVAYTAVVLTEPETAKRKAPRRPAASARALEGFTEEDMKARFARYAGAPRDAFLPRVVPSRSGAPGAGALPFADAGIWLLTGINVINGVRNALLENGATGETVFVRSGERWNGLLVFRIEPNAVLFVNDKGKMTRIAFLDPDAEKPAGVAPVLVPPVAGSPTPLTLPSPRAATPAPRPITIGNLP